MNSATSYNTIAKPSSFEIKEKGSKFISYAYPVENEKDIKARLEHLKEQYPDATHHCYAYVLPDGETYRANDDGEPGNSAGMPIYRQILSKDVVGTLVVVIRYYGGTKLGVPGLISAYGTAAKLALENTDVKEIELSFSIEIKGKTGEEHIIFVAAGKLDGKVDVIDMGLNFTLKCTFPEKRREEVTSVCQTWHRFEIKDL